MIGKPKMVPRSDATAGLETEEKGNTIPFVKRNPEVPVDRKIGSAMRDASMKDPEGEAIDPAPMPKSQQGQGGQSYDADKAGHQGGQQGGGPDFVQHH